jgi:hypothetical protein
MVEVLLGAGARVRGELGGRGLEREVADLRYLL